MRETVDTPRAERGVRGDAPRFRQALAGFVRAQGAASAIEFAFLTPLLLLLFAAVVEIPRALATNNRLNQATLAMADLISVNDFSDINDIFAAADVVAAPYTLSGAGIVLTAGGVYQAGNAFVARTCSSLQLRDNARIVGSDIGPPPAGTASKGDRFVMAETRLAYRPLVAFFPFLNGLTFTSKAVWPVRGGVARNGQAEVVLPGGKPCPP